MSDALAPYVPRLVVDWVADEPERRHRTVAGTLVFADISGFTALTERLAVRGKAGAEEMSDILNHAFEKLLTAAYDYGANLIKWGGDAVLLMFDGERHAARAAAAASSMQQVMRGIGKLQTSAGQVRLGMSIGMNTGEIDFLLVGSLHRELIVTGPTATTTALLEREAERGDILMSQVTAGLLPAACRGAAKGDGILLRRAPDIGERPNRLPKRDGVDVGIAMCSQLREHLRAGQSDYEHRTVTVGFVELDGTDDLLAEHGPDALTIAVGDAVAAVQEAAADNGVTMLSSDMTANGIKIILTSGVPSAAGDDETRVLSALRQIVQPGGRLRVRAGVTRGSAFAGDYGPFYRKTYSITGDIVNLAARLMTKAEPGQIVALVDVVRRSRTAFETTALAPFAVKGKTAEIAAVLVGSVRAAADRDETERRSPLVGRDSELALLLDAASRAAAGSGQVVEIIGPPGMGKSRLTDELVARMSARVMWADGDIYARATPYQPMQRLLRRTLGIAAETSDAEVAQLVTTIVTDSSPDLIVWLPLIGIVAGVDLPSTPEVEILDPEVRRSRLETVASDLLGRLLVEPIVFVFNDIQFMDDATVGFVRRLAEDARDRPWLLVLTCRPEVSAIVPADEHAHRIVLEPLRASAADQLVVEATEDAPLPSHRMRQLVERAGGNPLFLQQLVAGALGGADLDELPDSVEGMIAARIDTLPLARRQWLRAASVLGNTIDPVLLARIAGDDSSRPWDGLDEFIVLGDDRQLRFIHHLVRLTAYEGLPFRRRTELHARAAEALEAAGAADHDVSVLAMHCLNGGRYDKAWKYAREAGDQARDAYAPSEAAENYGRAVAAATQLKQLPERELIDVYEALSDVRMDLGEKHNAEHALERARQLARSDPMTLAKLQLKTADQRQQGGQYPSALTWLSRATKSLGAANDRESASVRAAILELSALIRLRQGKAGDAIRAARKAVEQARHGDNRAAAARAQETLSLATVMAGKPWDDQGFRHSLTLYGELGNHRGLARAYNKFGVAAYYAGRWNEAASYFRAAEKEYGLVGREEDAVTNGINLAEILIEQGNVDDAEPLLAPAIRVWRTTGATSFLAFGIILTGRVCLARDEFAQALGHFQEARELCIELGEVDNVLQIDGLTAECHLRAGDAIAALQLAYDSLLAAGRLADPASAEPLLHRIRGVALMRLGRRAEAEDALRMALSAARGRSANHDIARALRLLLRLPAGAETEVLTWTVELEHLTKSLGLREIDVDSMLTKQ